jgi:hypothetical protein
VNQAHEQVADLGPVQSPIEQCVLAVQHSAFQCPFDQIMPIGGLCRVNRFPNLLACFLMVDDAA